MTVYADSLFLINLLSEYVLLTLCGKIASAKSKKSRRLFASIFGALISTAVFCADIPLPQSIVRIITAFLTICIAYIRNYRAVLRAFPAFMLTSFLYSGIILTASSLLPESGIISCGFAYIRADLLMFACIFVLTYPVILLLARAFKISAKHTVKITVSHCGKTAVLTALFDSGNLLTDGNRGVIIAEWDIVKALFGTENFEDLYGLDGTKLVPFGSLGGVSTALVFYADTVFTETNTFKHIPIGIVNRKIIPSGTCNALIGKQYI